MADKNKTPERPNAETPKRIHMVIDKAREGSERTVILKPIMDGDRLIKVEAMNTEVVKADRIKKGDKICLNSRMHRVAEVWQTHTINIIKITTEWREEKHEHYFKRTHELIRVTD